MLGRLARRCHNRRGVVALLWIAALVLVGVGSGAAGSGFTTEFSPPDVESAEGLDILEENFDGMGAGFGGTIVFQNEAGFDDPALQEEIDQFLAEVDEVDGLTVVSPFSGGPEGAQQIAQQGPLAGELVFARVEVGSDVSVEDAATITTDVKDLEPDLGGVRVEYGGQLFAEFVPPESEVLGLGFAIVILVLAFGSVMAMGLPIGTAFGGIGVGVGVVVLLSNVVEMPDFTTSLGVMIGLGVGIDYALFIVTRYREGRHTGLDSEAATVLAIDTAGRAVLFAGTTVVISLLGMLLMGLAFVNGLAIGAVTVVLVTMLASITLLPALLGFVQDRVEISRWRGVIAAGLVAIALIGLGLTLTPFLVALPLAVLVLIVGSFVPALKREVPRRAPKPQDQTLPYRWSRLVQRRPWTSVVVGTVVLVALALPVFAIRLGFSDEGNYPEDTSTRQAYDLLAEGFGPGSNGPLILATELPGGGDEATLGSVQEALAGTEGVAFATPAQVAENGEAARFLVIPETAPQDEDTEQLLERLREDVVPPAVEGSGLDPAFTGSVAISADFSSYLGARLPLFIGVVLALSFLLLLVVFRSLLVPLKAVVMNLLSIGAAYGVVVAVFQWGWGGALVGTDGGPIEPFIPMMMFAIVFGLSMDYEVFLLSRVKEEYDSGKANDVAVADGLAATARVITAAAAIMVVVFGSFLLENDRVLKVFGVGLATAVLLDATIVRMLLVPATMELLGDRNWWLPRWIGRILPKVAIEGHRPPPPPLGSEPEPEPERERIPVAGGGGS